MSDPKSERQTSQLSEPASPPAFQDRRQRTWQIDLTYGLIDRVQRDTQIDLAPDDYDVSPVVALSTNHRKLLAVLWECCRGQGEEVGVDYESFADSLSVDELVEGWEALLDAVRFFIQRRSPQALEAVDRAVEAQVQLMEEQAAEVARVMSSDQTKQAIREQVRKAGGRLQRDLLRDLASLGGD